MPDATGKKLLRLLRPDQPPETRRAAALVLGEVGTRDAELTAELLALLDEPDADLRTHAMGAIGKLRIDAALPKLLERVGEGGREADAAALAAARLGAKGVRALQEAMPRLAPGLRRRIASALAAAGTAGAETAALDALLDNDPGVVDAAARSLSAEIPTLDRSHRKALADHLLDLLADRQAGSLSLATQTAAVRLLAALGDDRAAPVFWDRAAPPHPTELRAAALQALGKFAAAPSRDQLRLLLACAAERDFHLAAPALMLLRAVPVEARLLAEWLTLLDAPDVAARRAGLEKLAGRDTAAVAAALIRQLRHPDRAWREEALAHLAKLSEGRKALVGALLGAETPDEAWQLARAQAALARDYPPALRQQVFDQARAYLEAGDRRAEPLLFLLREAEPRELRDRLEERALALRKKKDYDRALTYLRLLARDPACAAAVRLELAAVGLKLSPRDLSADARAADPCLQQFASLIHSHEAEATAFLEKAKWLEPEDLFYLGFHFAEKDRQQREFGGTALRLLVKRSPKSKLAKDARTKLKREGLA